jgi:hypothetical protein
MQYKSLLPVFGVGGKSVKVSCRTACCCRKGLQTFAEPLVTQGTQNLWLLLTGVYLSDLALFYKNFNYDTKMVVSVGR